MISSKTHSMEIIDERDGFALIEITKDGAPKQSEYRFYVVEIQGNQVCSTVPADMPENGTWVGGFTVGGVAYVANGRKRATARRWFNRLAMEARAERAFRDLPSLTEAEWEEIYKSYKTKE